MRSRYCAFVVKDFDYLLQTHDPETRHEFDLSANKAWAQSVQFVGLEILKAAESLDLGHVEFIARFKELKGDKVGAHHEKSIFRRWNGRWYFRRGTSD